jgi:hypothetical protein
MKISVSNADELFEKAYNKLVLDLLSKQEVSLFAGCVVTIPETIIFSLTRSGDKIVVTMQNAKPKIRIGGRYLLKVDGILEKIEIEKDKILLTINGLPDILLEKA